MAETEKRRTKPRKPSAKKAPEPRGLAAPEVAGGGLPADMVPAALRDVAGRVRADGGTPIGAYRDPFGGRWVLLVVLPIEKVEATPYQRELSKPHVARLAAVIEKLQRFLDPVILTPEGGRYITPNGMHRLEAMRSLGARSITGLLVPERDVALQILALNTEKAHNLKDRSLEAIRMARALAARPETADRPESDWAFELEEPAYLTIGLCYEERPRYSGGAYYPIVRRCEEFSPGPIARSLEERKKRAARLLALDDAVNACVEALKEHGLKSAYLKPFVVARLNPLRFQRAPRPGRPLPRADLAATIEKMLASAKKFDASKVKPQDVARMGGGVPAEEE
jgi:ParB family chromosome partitioning protein